MRNVYLFQPQYDVDYRDQKQYWIPYSAGTIWAYSAQFPEIRDNFQLADIVFRREPHSDVLARMSAPSVCAFSCYQWNRTYSIKLAELIHQRWPDCVMVFGGPEVTLDFLDHEFVDTVVLGEGELAFREILDQVRQGQTPQEVYRKQRIEDLNIPSPYGMGIFDDLIRRHPGALWATTLETNRGCPFSCTFCDWGSVTYSKIKRFSLERVQEDLEWISRNPVTYVVCADANFGIFKERDLVIAEMVAEAGRRNPDFTVFNATFNKNNNEWSFRILEVLGELNRGFTVSVQSMNPATLKAIKRDNMGINDLEKIFRLTREHGVNNSYTELILGLPLETRDTFIGAICDLLELGQHGQIEVYFTNMLVNSELADRMSRRLYGIKTVATDRYLTLTDPENDDGMGDVIEVVSATSTMSTPEMIESYMFGWMVVNFHHQGFSQLASRWARAQGVSYRDFYHALRDEIAQDPVLAPIMSSVTDMITRFLNTGALPGGYAAHNMIFCRARDLYDSRQQVFDVINRVFQRLVDGDVSAFDQLQRSLIYDAQHAYPMTVNSGVDIDRWESRECVYEISNKFHDSLEHFRDAYYTLRRKGALKNVYRLK